MLIGFLGGIAPRRTWTRPNGTVNYVPYFVDQGTELAAQNKLLTTFRTLQSTPSSVSCVHTRSLAGREGWVVGGRAWWLQEGVRYDRCLRC